MTERYTQEELKEYLYEALSMFNEVLDTDITPETVVIDFFTPENGLAVYRSFCEKYFPDRYEKQHEAKGYFEFMGAEAFVGDKQYGVLIRSDIDFTLGEVLMIFLHEISHLFCTKNEIDGGDFYDKYCMGSGEEDGFFNDGYAVWREAIADIMADSIMSEYATMTLGMAAPEIRNCYDRLCCQNSEAKKCMSLIIGYIMISKEVSGTEDWKTAQKAIKSKIKINNDILMEMLRLVFEKLHKSPFWRITPEFIRELGFLYTELITLKTFASRCTEQK